MKRARSLAFGLLTMTAFMLPVRLRGQDAPAVESYKGDPLCSVRRGEYPRRIYTPEPEYDDKARKKKIQGTVLLSLIVTKEGDTTEIKVEKSLTPDLDRQAVKAVSRWKFDPLIHDDKACPTRIKVETSFHIY